MQFVMMFNDNLVTTGLAKTKGISLFWTMVDGREKTELYDLYGKLFAENNFHVLDTRAARQQAFPPRTVRRPQVGVPLDHPSAGHRHAAWKPYPGVVGRNMFHHQRISVMASRKLNTEGIDESLLLASIGKSRQMGDTLAREEAGNAESAIKPSVADPSENAARTVETKTKARNPSGRKGRITVPPSSNGAS